MRKNRKRSTRMSVIASRSVNIGAVLLMLFAMVIVNILASTNCNDLLKKIGEKDRCVHKLDEDLARENARWNTLQSPENLERMLLKHGMAMRYAKPGQIVRIDSRGRARAGQQSLARFTAALPAPVAYEPRAARATRPAAVPSVRSSRTRLRKR